MTTNLEPAEYCEKFAFWRDAMLRKLALEFANPAHEYQRQEAERDMIAINRVSLLVSKSNLLWRTVYRGEEPRTVECPTHKGRWHGLPGFCACDGTGWLPNAERPR